MWLRKRAVRRELVGGLDLRRDLRLDCVKDGFAGYALSDEMGAEQLDRVTLHPRLALRGVAVVGAETQALGMLVEAIGDDLDEARSVACACAVHRRLHRGMDLEHVLTVLNADARHVEAWRALCDDARRHRVGWC